MGGMKLDGITVIIDREDHYMLRLEDAEKLFFDISFKSPDERDIYAIIIRDLAGDSIELRRANAHPPASSQPLILPLRRWRAPELVRLRERCFS